jgi:hypothetical protein
MATPGIRQYKTYFISIPRVQPDSEECETCNRMLEEDTWFFRVNDSSPHYSECALSAIAAGAEVLNIDPACVADGMAP